MSVSGVKMEPHMNHVDQARTMVSFFRDKFLHACWEKGECMLDGKSKKMPTTPRAVCYAD